MPFSDKEKLFHDILQESDYEQFRADVFRASAHEFRRYHRKKSFHLALAIAACLAALIFSASLLFTTKQQAAKLAEYLAPAKNIPSAKQIIPPVLFEIIHSRAIPDSLVVRSVPNRFVMVETSPASTSSDTFVRTIPNLVPFIADSELLGLFSDRPAGFFHTGSHKEFFVLDQPLGIRRPPLQ
jgi:hypothetical protein